MAQFNSSLSAWKQLYEAAILELDHGKLLTLVADARRAIHERATEPTGDLFLLSERQALNDALRTLQILEEVARREKNAA
jgi:hypothetical protein